MSDEDDLDSTLEDVLVPCPRCAANPGHDPGDELVRGNGCWLCGGVARVRKSSAEIWIEAVDSEEKRR